jgi:hypothetical protein
MNHERAATHRCTASDLAIACVPWPSDADRRVELARAGVPRLLFVEPGAAPPELWDLDEDWVRIPTSAEEVTLRADTLRRRLRARIRPDEVIHTPT